MYTLNTNITKRSENQTPNQEMSMSLIKVSVSVDAIEIN